MDYVTSQDFLANANSRRVTRRQVQLIKQCLPFLALPAELRNVVYSFCIEDLGKLNEFFGKCFEKLSAAEDTTPRGLLAPPSKQTPAIFLINKQIFREASYLLQKQCVSFKHGLLKYNLSDVISPNILRQVSSLEITDAGHPMIQGALLPAKWSGYMRIFKQLGELLSTGDHKLKKLTVRLDDPRLVEHMVHCHTSIHKCGFRDQMSEALAILSKARGIQEVVFRGLNVHEAAKLQRRMQGPAISFLSLPPELRDMVYEHALDWSDSSVLLGRAVANWSGDKASFPFPHKITPTVLLLNKQTSIEALQVLQKKPLNIIYPAVKLADKAQIPSILGFISRNTIKNVTSINIDMQCWQWVFNIDDRLGGVLAASKNLKHFTLRFTDSMRKDFNASTTQSYPDLNVATSLKRLMKIRGLQYVKFSGDLPDVFTNPLEKIMTSDPSIALADLPKLKAESPTRVVEDIEERDREPLRQLALVSTMHHTTLVTDAISALTS